MLTKNLNQLICTYIHEDVNLNVIMRTTNEYINYGFTCLGIGVWLLWTAVLGFLDVTIRGHALFGVRVKSMLFRVVCFVLSVGFFVAAAWMFRHLSLP
jgi:hypothetical protein